VREENILQRLSVALIRGYQSVVSPWVRPACRFVPTCSEYAVEAVSRHGVCGGIFRAARRLLRCHPLHAGGVDLVD
jgi:putative membrane protein insertion efficiency factor